MGRKVVESSEVAGKTRCFLASTRANINLERPQWSTSFDEVAANHRGCKCVYSLLWSVRNAYSHIAIQSQARSFNWSNGIDDLLDVRTWNPPTDQEMGEYFGMLARQGQIQSDGPATNIVRLQVRELAKRFTPVELYCYLKSQIGFANGVLKIQSIFGPASSGDLCHWQFVLKSPAFFAEFQSSQNGLMMFLYSAPPLSESEWSAIENSLRQALNASRTEISKVKASLEDWAVFINPYKRLNDVVATLEERACAARLIEPELPWLSLTSGGWTDEERESFLEDARAYSEALVDAQLIGVAIRSNVPIWIESFVNLVLFTLAKPRIKNDTRLFENQTRQQIDVRVKMLGETCEGFHRHVSDNDEPFKDMQRLFQRRNTTLHGSIDVKSLTTDQVYFDGNRPVYNEWLPDYSRRIPKMISFIEPMAAREDIVVGSEFIIYLANLLDKPTQEQLWAVAETPLLGYRKDNRRLGILFPGPLYFPVFGSPTGVQRG